MKKYYLLFLITVVIFVVNYLLFTRATPPNIPDDISPDANSYLVYTVDASRYYFNLITAEQENLFLIDKFDNKSIVSLPFSHISKSERDFIFKDWGSQSITGGLNLTPPDTCSEIDIRIRYRPGDLKNVESIDGVFSSLSCK